MYCAESRLKKQRGARTSPETTVLCLCGLSFWLNNMQPELPGSFENRSDLLFGVPGFIVFGVFVHVLLVFGQQPVEQEGELASHKFSFVVANGQRAESVCHIDAQAKVKPAGL
jgi:hypothetical protein